jgi:hypothetical protein
MDRRGLAPRIDLRAAAGALGADLDQSFALLAALYAHVDARNQINTAGLDLPCHRGCSACCHESVFLTPLEFFYAWDFVQRELDDSTRSTIVGRALALFHAHKQTIERVQQDGAMALRFDCPLLGDDGACRVYAARELYARLFGCSLHTAGGIYGCHMVGAHLAGKDVRLLQVRPIALRLNELPLTFMRQVYPYYIHLFYGAVDPEPVIEYPAQ